MIIEQGKEIQSKKMDVTAFVLLTKIPGKIEFSFA